MQYKYTINYSESAPLSEAKCKPIGSWWLMMAYVGVCQVYVGIWWLMLVYVRVYVGEWWLCQRMMVYVGVYVSGWWCMLGLMFVTDG